MKFFAIISLFLAGFVGVADAATPQQRRGQSTANTATTSTGTVTTGARAAVSARAARTAPTTASANTSATGARAAVSARAGKTQTVTNTITNTSAPTVSARAATKTKSVKASGSTKVEAAGENLLVNAECTKKYEGCMNAFCMLENVSGGRCLCSDRITELDQAYAEIEKMKDRTLQLSTTGIDILEMGDVADDVLKNVQSVTDVATGNNKAAERKKLTDSLFDLGLDVDEEDIFGSDDDPMASPIDGKTGNDLRLAAHDLCAAAMPAECANDLNMITLVYTRKIASDCSSYENQIKKDTIEAQQALTQAEQNIRSKALQQYQESNKYDLGQCTIAFKNCMAGKGICEEDFTGCVGIAAAENAKKSSKTKTAAQKVIKGTATQISIAASSYDALISKKPMCENVTKNCTRVKDQVWDTFLQEIAPTIKSAELIAEDDLRQSCMSNISDCIVNACKDSIDPDDEKGSYDLCLAYPDSVSALCKVQIEPCQAANPNIMSFVKIKLEGMRDNACSNQVRTCLTNENRCGPDYAKCAGMDATTIADLCPDSSLTACFDGDKINHERVDYAVEGLIANIEDSLLKTCQNALTTARITICGDDKGGDEYCAKKIVKSGMGAGSLKYQICNENGDKCYDDISQLNSLDGNEIRLFGGRISGMINWNRLMYDENGYLVYGDTNETQDQTNLPGVSSIKNNNSDPQKDMIYAELTNIASAIKMTIKSIESDAKVQQCMEGRKSIKAARNKSGKGESGGDDTGIFPNLTDSLRQKIAQEALDLARNNYYEKFNELDERKTKGATELSKLAVERDATIAAEEKMAVRREVSRQSCVDLGNGSTTSGGSQYLKDWYNGNVDENLRNKYGDSVNDYLYAISGQQPLSGSHTMDKEGKNRSIYKETVYTTFSMDTLICKKCVRTQNCNKARKGYNNRFCLDWADPTEACQDIQF